MYDFVWSHSDKYNNKIYNENIPIILGQGEHFCQNYHLFAGVLLANKSAALSERCENNSEQILLQYIILFRYFENYKIVSYLLPIS